MPVLEAPKRGATPSPRSVLAAASPHVAAAAAPPNFLTVPGQISMWGNYYHGTCVTAEEAFAKACNTPEIFIPENDVISWATKHGVLEGAVISQELQVMQNDGFQEGGSIYDDGPYSAVNWANSANLQSAISNGPVKIGVAADQLVTVWHAAGGNSTGGKSGWFAVGFHADPNYDHCVSLCGYGTISWLAKQLNVPVPAGVDGTKTGYALFTWDSIGIIDEPSLRAITCEAWLRQPTTVAQAATAPMYTQSGSLNDKSYNLGAAMQPIGPAFQVKKLRSGTALEIELAGTVSASAITGANGIRLEIRASGLNPNFKIQGSLKAGHLYDSIYTKSVYTALAIGTYTVQVYAQAAPAGTATGVILDPGGWGEAILATEF